MPLTNRISLSLKTTKTCVSSGTKKTTRDRIRAVKSSGLCLTCAFDANGTDLEER